MQIKDRQTGREGDIGQRQENRYKAVDRYTNRGREMNVDQKAVDRYTDPLRE